MGVRTLEGTEYEVKCILDLTASPRVPRAVAAARLNSTGMAESTYCMQRPFDKLLEAQGTLGPRKRPSVAGREELSFSLGIKLGFSPCML